MEHGARHGKQVRVDVPGRRVVRAPHGPSAELADRREQVDVVAAHVVLRHVDDGALHRCFPVMEHCVLRHVGCQLRHAHLFLKVALDASEKRLALRHFEAVDRRWDGAQDVVVRKVLQVEVDELLVAHLGGAVVERLRRVVRLEPQLALVGALLVERHAQRIDRRVVVPPVSYDAHVAKVAPRLLRS